jgi:hypothetical protein
VGQLWPRRLEVKRAEVGSRSQFIEMTLDHDTGTLEGVLTAGPKRGAYWTTSRSTSSLFWRGVRC